MTAVEVARELGCSERTVRRAIKAGRLLAHKPNARRFDIDLDAARVALGGSYRAALRDALDTLREVGYGADADEIKQRYGIR